MRQIKFRVWDKKEKKMRVVIEIGWYAPDKFNVKVDDGNWLLSAKDEFELVEFTGLKDSKGVEIYEGDIVQTYWGDKPTKLLHKGIVQFDNEKLQFMIGKAPLFNTEVEIIGNIYENKDLLK